MEGVAKRDALFHASLKGGETSPMFSRLWNFIRSVVRKILPYRAIESIEDVESPLSTDMVNALDDWYNLYLNRAEWLSDTVKSLNLPAFISSEIARQIVLEMKWNITGKNADGETQEADGGDVMNPRAEYLKKEFERCIATLRLKLEQGCAAGGMTIKPYPKDGHIYFDWTMDWSLYPIAFDDDGNLADVIFRDTYTEGKTIFTRLERHTVEGDSVKITQRAFKSSVKDAIGVEIPLSDVPFWENLEPEATVQNTGGQMFGWYKVATANSIDTESPMGASVFAKSRDLIQEADKQYSRLLWEYEGSELAIDVDPTVLRPKKTEGGGLEMPKLNQRLFRAVDADKGDRDLYNVFSPQIRDTALVNGLNQILMRIEDQCGLARGTISDANTVERTATELNIVKQRTYVTISDNQTALEHCLKDVIRAMDVYATLYDLAPEGEYEVSFEWDDSIITDTEQQMNEHLMLLNAGLISKAEFREWYFGETKDQAQAAIDAISEEEAKAQMAGMAQLLPTAPGGGQNPPEAEEEEEEPQGGPVD